MAPRSLDTGGRGRDEVGTQRVGVDHACARTVEWILLKYVGPHAAFGAFRGDMPYYAWKGRRVANF